MTLLGLCHRQGWHVGSATGSQWLLRTIRRCGGMYTQASRGRVSRDRSTSSTDTAQRCWACGAPGHRAAQCTAPVSRVYDENRPAGVRYLHRPVMLQETLQHLLGPRVRQAIDGSEEARVVLDATFGAGGHTVALLAAGAAVVATDRDPAALELAAALRDDWPEERLRWGRARFGNLEAVAAPLAAAMREGQGAEGQEGCFDGVLFDLGMSSLQLDDASRGFAFSRPGPLDMRMEDAGPSAADIVAVAGRKQLADIIRNVRFRSMFSWHSCAPEGCCLWPPPLGSAYAPTCPSWEGVGGGWR